MVNTLRNTYHMFWSYVLGIGAFWWFCLMCLSLVVGCVLLVVQHVRNVPLRKLIAWELLATYVAAVLVCTVLSRKGYARTLDNIVRHINLDAVGTISSRLRGPYGQRAEVLLNLVMLTPVGFLLPPATGRGFKGTVISALALVMVIEVSQLLLAKGSFELSDIIENVASAVFGFGAWKMLELMIGPSMPTTPSHPKRRV